AAGDSVLAAGELEPDEEDDAAEAEDDTRQAHAGDALALVVRDREERREERGGGVEDRGEPGVDVLLSPGDEKERHGRVDETQERERPRVRQQRPEAAAGRLDEDGECER